MHMKRSITLFLGLIFLCFGFTPILTQNKVTAKFQAGGTDRDEIDFLPQPLSSVISLDEGDYYLVRGEKVFIRRDPHRIAVKFKNTTSNRLQRLSGKAELQSDFLHQTLNTAGIDADLMVDRQLRDKDITIINIRSRSAASPQLLRSQIREITATDSVEYATPVFLSGATMDELVPTNELLIRFKPDYSQAGIDSFCAKHRLTIQRVTSQKLNVYALSVDNPNSRSTITVANTLNSDQDVVWAQPNFIHKLKLNSVNDPLFENQWYLSSPGKEDVNADVDAVEAWAVQTASPDITIAIIDDGVDLAHEDLDIWLNPNETPDNQVDDDGNGYVDDIHGWDFYTGDNSPDADYANNHGTSCAGVAAAKGNNNVGIAGIAYGSKILPVKIVGGPDGEFTDAASIGNAIIYAADHADIISCSWGIASDSYVSDAIDYAVEHGRKDRGCPVFFAAGNSAARGVQTTLMFRGFPVGYRNVAWGFVKDDAEEIENDAAWIDDVELGVLETFETVTPPNFPDEDWYTNGDGNWETVRDLSHATGNIALKSGDIENNQVTVVGVSKYLNTPDGNLSYRVWVDAGPGDGLVALVYNGADWVPYTAFLGEGVAFPASYENSIAVGASNDEGILTGYSQYGDALDFVAPSSDGSQHQSITTTDRTGSAGRSDTDYTDSFGGTSSAAPLAAGIAALLLSKDPELTASDIRTVMQDACDKNGDEAYDDGGSGWNKFYGYGKVNAYKSIMALEPNAASPEGGDSGSGGGGGDGGGGGCFINTVF